MATNKYLRIYLQDHHAGATAGFEVAKRALSSNRESEFGPFFERMVQELAEDRAALEEVMESLDVPKAHYKSGAMWVAEKMGRLKLNGQLTGYSPLSRVMELEGLAIGIRSKLSMWNTLKIISGEDGRIVMDFDRLAERGQKQLDGIEENRLRASELAFTG